MTWLDFRTGLREMISDSELLDDALKARFLQVIGTLAAIIQAGIQQGVFRMINPFFVHINIMSNLVLYTATRSKREILASEAAATAAPDVAPPDLSSQAFAEHLETMILTSLEPNPEDM